MGLGSQFESCFYEGSDEAEDLDSEVLASMEHLEKTEKPGNHGVPASLKEKLTRAVKRYKGHPCKIIGVANINK